MSAGKVIPIESRANARQPLGMPPAQFLRDYWQKRPLLIRGMFAVAQELNRVSPDDLAGLACEEGALSRIVRRDAKRDRWRVRNGPFRERDFARLGKRDWTLLVQDVDKWDMDVAALLDHFRFIPSWRIDDVMISYATDGGGVGPHVDHYDVFLVQAAGWRRWNIDAGANPRVDFRDDAELKLLREFNATHEWLLDPGDALYLPPGVPHDGIAIGECLTWSVGMRAPSRAEMLFDFAEFLAEPLTEEQRYVDPDLAPARDTGEIDAAALARVRSALPRLAQVDDSTLAHWFGRFITRYRSAQIAVAAPRPISPDALRRRLARHDVMRNPFSRYAWRRAARAAEMFVAGEAWTCPAAFARLVCASREIGGVALARACTNAQSWNVLAALLDFGHLQFVRKSAR